MPTAVTALARQVRIGAILQISDIFRADGLGFRAGFIIWFTMGFMTGFSDLVPCYQRH